MIKFIMIFVLALYYVDLTPVYVFMHDSMHYPNRPNLSSRFEQII